MSSPTVAKSVRDYVTRVPAGKFIRARDLVDRFGSRAGVDVALSRLADSDAPLVRVRNGLYWRAPHSRFGNAKPRPFDVAVEVARADRNGVGPAGWTALRTMGLSTQVPTRDEVALIGPAPSPVPGAVFRSRSNPERNALSFFEIAALEALREVPEPLSPEWSKVVATYRDMNDKGLIRWKRVCKAAANERHPKVRNVAAVLNHALSDRSAVDPAA